MVVLDYELNLSKTEFLYYLECPQKFRIHRILNPIPYKTTFMNTRRKTSNYILRNYSGKNIDGIINHSFFDTFHKKYWNRITESEPPDEIASNQIKLLYWQYQQKKYFDDPEHWIPFQMELRLMTERQRGIIDCVEVCSDKNGLRIIDYKSKPHSTDKQALLFYANLLNEYRIENWDYDNLLYNSAEMSCYYYVSGEERIYTLREQDLVVFKELLSNIFDEISNEEFTFKTTCFNCDYLDICQIQRRCQ